MVNRMMARAVAKIKTPQDLQQFVKDPLRAAAAQSQLSPARFADLSSENSRNLFYILGKGWLAIVDQLSCEQPPIDWAETLDQVKKSLTHVRIAPELLEPYPAQNLTETCRQTGLNSLSWNSWFYTAQEETILSQQLLYMDGELSMLSGLPPGCLGLFGSVNLELDGYGNHCDGAEFYIYNVTKELGQSSTGLRLNHTGSWESLSHEWMHAVDFMVARSHNIREIFFSQESTTVQQMLLDVVSRPDPTANEWWEYLNSLNWPENKYVEQLRRMKLPLNNFWGDYIAQEEEDYFKTFHELLAYQMTQASCDPKSKSNLIIMGTEQNRKDAHECIRTFFALPEVVQSLQNMQKIYSKNIITKSILHRRQKLQKKTGGIRPGLSTHEV